MAEFGLGIAACNTIEFPTVRFSDGNLTFVESGKHVPFPIARVFYQFDISAGAERGAHAHRLLQQVLICLSGAFDLSVDDGREKSIMHVDRPWRGVYLPPMIWTRQYNFAPGSVCLVLASLPYDEGDYYRDYGEFLADVRSRP